MAGYFDLRLPGRQAVVFKSVDGGSPTPETGWTVGDVFWVFLVYAVQVAGVLAKQVYDDIGTGKPLHLPLTAIIIAAIVSAVSFPSVYGNLQAQSGAGLRLFLAFQSGFFWRSVLTQVTPQ
ncbi:MAG: hypothetical protein ACUVX9_00530 [Anaerolineae bacterium]